MPNNDDDDDDILMLTPYCSDFCVTLFVSLTCPCSSRTSCHDKGNLFVIVDIIIIIILYEYVSHIIVYDLKLQFFDAVDG